MRLFVLLYSVLLFFWLSPKAQPDSLGYILNYLQSEVADDKLKQALQEANAIYLSKTTKDSLSAKLLAVSGLLEQSSIDKQKILSYNLAVTETLRKFSPEGGHIDYAYSLDHLAGSFQRFGKYEEALLHSQKSLSIKGKSFGEDHINYAAGLHNVGDIYFNMRGYDKALPLYQKELIIKGKKLGESSYEYVDCLISMGWAHNYLGHYDTALLLSQDVLILIKSIPKLDSANHANSLMNIARLYQRMGQYDRSMSLYEQALAMKKQAFGVQHFEYGVALVDVAYFYHKIIGNYENALKLYKEALPIIEEIVEKNDAESKRIGERLHYMHRLNLTHLGTVHYLMRDYEKAVSFYEKTLKLSPRDITCMSNLALACFSMGHRDRSLSLCREISTVLERKDQNGMEYANDSKSLAVLYYEMGKYDSALPLFKNYLRITKDIWGKENLDYTRSLNSLGMIHTALGDDTLAATLFDEASNITLNHLSRTYASLSEQEKIAILQKLSDQFDFLPSLCFTKITGRSHLANKLYENVLSLKGMVLEDQQTVLDAIRKSGDSNVIQAFLKWNKHRAFIGAQHLLPLANRVPYLDSLENITNQLEQDLSRRSLVFRNQQRNKSITTKDVSQKLQRGQATIEFIRFQFYNKKWTDSILYAAIVLTPGDSIARFIPLFEEKQLQCLLQPVGGSTTDYPYIKHLYGSGKASDISNQKNLNDSLYNLIWKPLENHLKGVTTIYYAPAGFLHRIALNALRDDQNRFLIERYQLNQVLSTRSVALQPKTFQKPLTVSVWGDIDYDVSTSGRLNNSAVKRMPGTDTMESTFNIGTINTRSYRSSGWLPLPDAKKEIDLINKAMGKSGISISVVSGGRATEEAFKALDGKSPELLHLATHGFFLSVNGEPDENISTSIDNSFTLQQNPMFRSGLVLSGGNHAWKGNQIPSNREDGILTAYEIAQIDLSNTELLVLSACETALGDLKYASEGVIGLQRAFKLAGVKKMILSLWRVPDKATVELMNLFYKNWLGGQPIRTALHNAQMIMKEKYPAFYWAAFVVVE